MSTKIELSDDPIEENESSFLTYTLTSNEIENSNNANMSQVLLNDDGMFLQDLEDGTAGWTLDGLPILFTTDGQQILLNTLPEENEQECTETITNFEDEVLVTHETLENESEDNTDAVISMDQFENNQNDNVLLDDCDVPFSFKIPQKGIITSDGLFVSIEPPVEENNFIEEDKLKSKKQSQEKEQQLNYIDSLISNQQDNDISSLNISSELSELADVITSYKCKRCEFTCSDKQVFLIHFKDMHLQSLKNSISSTKRMLKQQTGTTDTTDILSKFNTEVNLTNLKSNVQNTALAPRSILIKTLEGTFEVQTNENESDVYINNKSVIEENERQNNESQMIVVKQEPSEVEEKCIYICSQCTRGFLTIPECRQHMIKDHKLKVIESWEQKNTESKPLIASSQQVLKQFFTDLIETPVEQETSPIIEPQETEEKKPVSIETVSQDKIKKLFNKMFHKSKKGNKIKTKLPFKCTVRGCSYYFATQAIRDKHVSCHVPPSDTTTTPLSNPRSYTYGCSECGEAQRGWRATALHLWRQHQIQTDLLSCPVCETHKATTPVKLQDHMQIHSDVRSFICEECGRGFKQRSQLRNHGIVHIDKKSEQMPKWYREKECTICQKVFSDSKCLKKHVQSIHSKLRPYICAVCGHSCARKAMLQLHLRQHTGEKPYACNHCTYRTGDHNSLRRHKMKHTGVRPYKCPHCPYTAIQSNSYKNHIASKHPGQTGVYACALCTFKSVSEETYVGHVADHANGVIPTRVSVEQNDKDQMDTDGSGSNVFFISTKDSGDSSQNIIIQTVTAKCTSPVSSDNEELFYLPATDTNDEQCVDTGGITIPAEPDCATLLRTSCV